MARGGYLWADQSDRTIPRFDIFSALERPPEEWEKTVAVLGGDYAACMVTLHLRRLGVEVHIYRETTAELLSGDRGAIQTMGRRSWLEVGAVVIGGRVPNNRFSDELWQVGLRAVIYPIRDALGSRGLYAAGQEPAEVAEKVSLMSLATIGRE